MRIFVPVVIVCAGCEGGDDGNGATFDESPPPPILNPPDTDTTGEPSTPPEDEQAYLLAPAQTDTFVFVANAEQDTLSRVDVTSYRVDTTVVGDDPHLVVTTPDYRRAVVFERGDDAITIVDANTLTTSTVPVRDNFNDLLVSPDGRFAVAWHNTARERDDDPPADGAQSFNEVSFVDLDTLEHFPMAVGFDPHAIVFTPNGALAAVVADAWLALVDLTVTPLVPRLLELAPDEADPPAAEEVVVAPDGTFAWVRRFGATDLLVVDLADGAIAHVPAGDDPTDLDLSPDGTKAVAVARTAHELWVYRVDAPFAAPEVIPLPETAYGSLVFDPTGDQAILFTTAAPVESFAVWDVATNAIVERPVVKPIASVAINPTGETAMVFHTETDGPNTQPLFAGSWALTLVALSDFRSNPLLLPSEPLGFANSLTGDRGYFAMRDEPFLEVFDYTTLLHEEITLGSIPTFVGVLPDLDPLDGDEPPAWVSQDHTLGRISFYDADDASLETLTGFELNSGVTTE